MRKLSIGVQYELDKMLNTWRESILYWADQSAEKNNHQFIEADDLDVAVKHLFKIILDVDDLSIVDNPSLR